MKKIPYITILTAFSMLFWLGSYTYMNILFVPIIWAVTLAIVLAGELIGTRVGKGARYASNIGAAVSAALILGVYALFCLYTKELRPQAPTIFYDAFGVVAVRSLLINLGSAAAKLVLVWREHHGALPSDDLTLKAFLPHLIANAALGVLDAAAYLLMFLFLYEFLLTSFASMIFSALNIVILAETANMIGIFADRLLEKRFINNILIGVVGIVKLTINIRSVAVKHNSLFYSDLLLSEWYFNIIAWAVILATDIVWAAVKYKKARKLKKLDIVPRASLGEIFFNFFSKPLDKLFQTVYTVYITYEHYKQGGEQMKILQNSDVPIYKQIAAQFKDDIMNGVIAEGEYLPSIRGLAKDLKISVITTMKAYEQLSEEGLISPVQGKGYIVNPQDREMVREQHLRLLEQHLQNAMESAKLAGVSREELIKMITVLYEI